MFVLSDTCIHVCDTCRTKEVISDKKRKSKPPKLFADTDFEAGSRRTRKEKKLEKVEPVVVTDEEEVESDDGGEDLDDSLRAKLSGNKVAAGDKYTTLLLEKILEAARKAPSSDVQPSDTHQGGHDPGGDESSSSSCDDDEPEPSRKKGKRNKKDKKKREKRKRKIKKKKKKMKKKVEKDKNSLRDKQRKRHRRTSNDDDPSSDSQSSSESDQSSSSLPSSSSDSPFDCKKRRKRARIYMQGKRHRKKMRNATRASSTLQQQNIALKMRVLQMQSERACREIDAMCGLP